MNNLAAIIRYYFAAPEHLSTAELLAKADADFKRNLMKAPKLHRRAPGYAYAGCCPVSPSSLQLSDVEKLLLFSLLRGEGNWTSINTYDNQGFTFGPGFSAKGMLPKVMEEWLKNPATKAKFQEHKFDINKLTNSNYLAGLQLDETKLTAFKDIGENPRCRASMISAMVKVLKEEKKGALKIPEYAKHWSDITKLAMAHLSHWLPSYGWHVHPNDYRSLGGPTNADPSVNAIKLFYQKAAEGKSRCTTAVDTNVVVPYKYGVGRMLNWVGGEELRKMLKHQCLHGKAVKYNRELVQKCLLFEADPQGKTFYIFQPITPIA